MGLGAALNQRPPFQWCKQFSFIAPSMLLLLLLLGCIYPTASAPPSLVNDKHLNSLHHDVWPPMQHHDIWQQKLEVIDRQAFPILEESTAALNTTIPTKSRPEIASINLASWRQRKSKVIRILPLPVDGDCLSSDGRRTGICLNAYQCRSRDGQARGNCAMGFGVCCIFVAKCNMTTSNNVTYLVSPNFPSFMGDPFYSCWLKIRLMSEDISQLRLDFFHFTLGQPNRRTGVCEGDSLTISGGLTGKFILCGQNSGQHIYYDVGGRALPRQSLYGSLKPIRYEDWYGALMNATNSSLPLDESPKEIEINLKFASRFLPSRLWEIRIAQIPFSQRAPAGCLQYFTGKEGFFQTFNFADNGRHLANQNYRICMRQELEMCSIVYQPCDSESFRVGPSFLANSGGPLNTPSSPSSMLAMFAVPPSSTNPFPNGGGSDTTAQLMSSMMSSMVSSNMMAGSSPSIGAGTIESMQNVSMSSAVFLDDVGNMSTPSTSSIAASSMAAASVTMLPITTAAGLPSTTSNVMMSASMSAPQADDPGGSTTAMTTTASVSTTTATTTTTTTTTTPPPPPPPTTTTTVAPPPSPTTISTPPPTATSPATAVTAATTTAPIVSTAYSSTAASMPIRSSTVNPSTTPQSDDVEGSGSDDSVANPVSGTTTRRTPFRRPRPIFGGGFDLFGLFSSALDLSRHKRQLFPATQRRTRNFFSKCRDRITMPCIVEDFIDGGWGPLPGCEPVHCGTQFCSTGIWPCRIESTVTPFYVGVHFGDGIGKGSAEDNIGACLRFSQVQCL